MTSTSIDNLGAKTLKDVSTLESLNASRLAAAFLFLILLVLGSENFAQETSPESQLAHSALDLVDPSFNAQISTASYGTKSVSAILPLPDGKILVGGRFNSYNGIATGSVVRLNSNGSLDTTFINGTVEGAVLYGATDVNALAVQPDGKILVAGVFRLNAETATRTLVRLNADGSLDTGFSFNLVTDQSGIRQVLVRPNGKIIVSSHIITTPNGVRGVVQLNSDGTLDGSFDMAANPLVRYIELQNGKLLLIFGGSMEMARLNDDGSFDSTFNRQGMNHLDKLYVQPDGKIIVQSQAAKPVRLNADGTND